MYGLSSWLATAKHTMKIGILTYVKEYSNLGTNMQCYCTLKALQKAYPDAQVEVVQYYKRAPVKRPYLSSISWQSLKYDYIRSVKYDKFFREEIVLSQDALVSSDPDKALEFIKKQNYDAIYVGADTVLELGGHGKDGLTAYWLDSRLNGIKVLIAASSHNVTAQMLSDSQRRSMQEAVNGFSLLGVRDDATFQLMSHFVGPREGRLQLVPDPTFTYDIDYRHAERYVRTRQVDTTRPIVCLHLLRTTKWGSALAAHFKRFGYLVASLRPAHYADILLTDLSPFEQMGIYKYFSLVITHRFHDSIFCLKNLTPVIAFPEYATDVTPVGNSKLFSLFRSFDLDRTHYLGSQNTLSADYFVDTYKDSIAVFNDRRDHISSVLQRSRQDYEMFVARSKALVS